MYYYERVPRPPIDAFVASIWLFRDGPRPHALERILPTAQLIVNLKEDRTRVYDPERPHPCIATAGTILAGVQSRYQIIDTSEQEYYYDQAHFIHEFRAFSGLTPTVSDIADRISEPRQISTIRCGRGLT